MVIKELNLIGFGKFKNQIIKLEDGINVVYGENEGGKSTLHSFIDGMFYGFLRPNVKSTLYTDEHKRYDPWNLDRYAGILKFISNGEDYRIERNFTKGKEETKVFLEKTGEDITYKINNGANGRVLQPGIHFMGISNSIFSNTVSIKQLGSRTDNKLANEVTDKLVNITSSFDDMVSVDEAIRDLEKMIKEIGTERATTSAYGKLCIELNSLLTEKKNIDKCKIEYEKLLDDNNELEKRLETLENRLKSDRGKLNLAFLKVKKQVYNEALNITNKLMELEETIKKYDRYKELSNEDYSVATKISNEIQILSNKIDDINSQVEELRIVINSDNRNINGNDDKNIKVISEDHFKFYTLEEEKNKLIYVNNNTKREFIKRDYELIKNKSSRYRITIVAMAVLYIALMGFSLMKNMVSISVFFQILLIPILFLIFKSNRLNKSFKEIGIKLMEIEQEEIKRNQVLSEIENNQRLILKRYNFTSKIQLDNLYNSIQQSQYIREEKLKTIIQSRNKLNYLNSKVEELSLELNQLENRLNAILINNFAANLKEFNINLGKKKIYDETLVEYYNKRELLKKTLGEYTLDQLEEELTLHQFEIQLFDDEDRETLQKRIDKITNEISENRIEKKGIEERLNLLGPKVSKLVDIEEDIARCKDEILKLDIKRKSLELAKNTIEELSKDIQDQFAPEINVKVGRLINRITNGKYSGVRINDKLEIGVITPDTGELINLDSLSGGTIDQLYFSLRFGIINSINDDRLPLILDDCFIQYDDIRLANILMLLGEISESRQVILFSCQNREKYILNRLGIKHNLVTLS